MGTIAVFILLSYRLYNVRVGILANCIYGHWSRSVKGIPNLFLNNLRFGNEFSNNQYNLIESIF